MQFLVWIPAERWSGGNLRPRPAPNWTGAILVCLTLAALVLFAASMGRAQATGTGSTLRPLTQRTNPAARPLPPRVIQARRFLAQRGWTPGGPRLRRAGRSKTQARAASAATATWQPLGPTAVLTPNYGLVTGRVSALALDPSDATGNRLYLGTTGGGVWLAGNAATSLPANVVFTPLTDNLAALGGITDASISIGALTVQPGATGVILAGTGDPNDALDSYYGAGILRSADGGLNWSLIQMTADQSWGFAGEGFAGFAWSTVNPQLVVAAVSQAYEGALVNADRQQLSYEGLYVSQDSGATWNLATITDGNGTHVQGPEDAFAEPDGNAATSVVWNPARQLFVAAVRFHGYYQSADGVTWTRMAAQPSPGLNSLSCPTNAASTGSIDCPILRGTLAVNAQTGDTFAWTVDIDNQDQGLWQDQCQLRAGACANQTISFAQQWNTAALETSTLEGPATIADGDYTLALAAMPAGPGSANDTLLFAGANDLWKCSLAEGCAWRNTTNASTCVSAQVAGYQHALGWSAANPLEMFVGNDSGLWRSLDAVGETGPVCASTDASHFQNLNGSLGSLAEVVSLSTVASTPHTMMAGLGVNGTAGTGSSAGPSAGWPQILGGYGGPVAIDPVNNANWYVNAEQGVSIYLCPDGPSCSPSAFGASPAITDADVGGDGLTMTTPAPFLVDPLDSTQLLIGTCRVWRGPANGSGWSAANAISPILDSGATGASCNGDALIRSMAAMALPGGGEVVYVGMFGWADGGAILPGHVLSATFNPSAGASPQWQDLTLNPVGNDSHPLNAYCFDISSIFIDPHDPTGNTLYLTVEGLPSQQEAVKPVYRSADGGAHWASLFSNLPWAPASSVVVDPRDAGTVYIATDVGVFFTTQVANCSSSKAGCWSAFGTGLPEAPVVALSAAQSAQSLVAATYGRGVWETPLWTVAAGLTTAEASPVSLRFPSQAFGTASATQTVTVTNTGSLALTPTAIAMSGDFSETGSCRNAIVAAGASCSIQITFTPAATGSRNGRMILSANVYGGQISVDLSGTGTGAGAVALTPSALSFGTVQVGTNSAALQVEAANSGASPIPIAAVAITAPFTLASNACGTSSLAANAECQLTVEFAPLQAGAAAGTLTFTDGAGTQTVALTGTGATPPTDILGAAALTFPATAAGQISAAQTVNLINSGGLPLTSIAVSISGPFQVTGGCGTQLAADSVCTLSLTFAPVSSGAASGTLTVADALRTQTVSLSGTGVAPAALSVSPSSLSFAAQTVGQPSAPVALSVTNSGASSMSNIGLQVTGMGAASFTVATNTCGALLNSGSSCAAQVVFTPAAAGGIAATLVVSSSTAGVAPVSVPLSGSGQAQAGLSASPPQLTFPAVAPGQSSAAQTVTVSNAASVAAAGLTLAIGAQFGLTQNTCSTSLAAGASCTVRVVFQPAASGPVSGVLTVSSSTIANPALVALSGTGDGLGAIEATPAVIAFSTVGIGTASAPTTLKVTNPGTTDFNNLALAVSAGFQLAGNTCAATLGAGASCNAGVEFAPTTAGAQTGNLTITSSTASAGALVALSGMGFDFTLTASGSTAQTVSSGQTAKYTLVITPLGGSQGAFALQCGTLPANAICLFTPPNETVGAGATGNVTAQISTGHSGSSAYLIKPSGWKLLPLACGLLLFPLACQRRRVLRLCALLAILVGGVSSCASAGGGTGGGPGGGSGSGSGSGSTPSGTYSIPLTVSSNGVQHSVTVTLNVD